MTTNITTPVLYALGSLTTALSFTVIGITVATVLRLQRART
jgi:putative spermidine/putrescine transport system permease protein